MVEQSPTGRGPVASDHVVPPDTGGPQTERSPADLQRQFIQVAVAIGVALLAVIAAQTFFLSRDVGVVSRDVSALGTRLERLEAEIAGTETILNEVPVLRAQVGEIKRLLQITARQGAGGEGGAPPGPQDWTGIYVSELGPLLPYLGHFEGEMGEAWIYSDNDNFLESLAETLQALEAKGLDVEVEQQQ